MNRYHYQSKKANSKKEIYEHINPIEDSYPEYMKNSLQVSFSRQTIIPKLLKRFGQTFHKTISNWLTNLLVAREMRIRNTMKCNYTIVGMHKIKRLQRYGKIRILIYIANGNTNWFNFFEDNWSSYTKGEGYA